MSQFNYLTKDIRRMCGKDKRRIIHIWMSRTFVGIVLYRVERSLYLLFGKSYGVLRIPFTPLLYLIQSYSNIDIHYKANIGGGIIVLHPSVGVVISGQSVIGANFTLVGGNVVGMNSKGGTALLKIGNNCTMGANSTIIGPLVLGDNIQIGASACVVKSYEQDNAVLVGIPAKTRTH
ncbi:MAG: serine acetyltransferase [Bacteroidetes bacterium]|nr:MAG: serine acetyltransferase [Bacteroidota bacterium]